MDDRTAILDPDGTSEPSWRDKLESQSWEIIGRCLLHTPQTCVDQWLRLPVEPTNAMIVAQSRYL